MSIQHLKNTVNQKLDVLGPASLPLSEPVCLLYGQKKLIPGREDINTGIWECTPGQFRRQIEAGEIMHILRGRCIFTPDGGESIEIVAGDTLFLSPNTTGVWNIEETVRKVYVLV